MQVTEHIGERIKIWRKHAGLRQQALADLLGLSQPNISMVEGGVSDIGLGVLIRFAQEFPELNMNWLLLGKGNMINSNENTNADATVPATRGFTSDVKYEEMQKQLSQARQSEAVLKAQVNMLEEVVKELKVDKEKLWKVVLKADGK